MLQTSWVGPEEVPIQFANQFLGQVQPPGEIIVSVGQIAPPAITGTPQEQVQQLQGWPFVPIKVIGRYGLTRARAVEFRDLLTRIIEAYDERSERGEFQ